MKKSSLACVLLVLLAIVKCNSEGADADKKNKNDEKKADADDKNVVMYSVSKKMYFFSGQEDPMFEIQVAKISRVDPTKKSQPTDKIRGDKKDSVRKYEASVQDICKLLNKVNPMLLPTSPLDFLAAHEFATYRNNT